MACSIRAIFVIHVAIVSNGMDHSVTRPLIRDYGKTQLATYTWDSLQGQALNFYHHVNVFGSRYFTNATLPHLKGATK